jgi:hypothetical protein
MRNRLSPRRSTPRACVDGERVRCSSSIRRQEAWLDHRCVSRRPRAQANGVATRLRSAAPLRSEVLEAAVGRRRRSATAEREPLDPERYAAPDGTTLIAELHGFLNPLISRQVERCAATQRVEFVRPSCPGRGRATRPSTAATSCAVLPFGSGVSPSCRALSCMPVNSGGFEGRVA